MHTATVAPPGPEAQAAAAGELDTSFGIDGTLRYAPIGCFAQEDFALFVDEPNQQALIGGTCVLDFTEASFMVQRLNIIGTRGSPDLTFGSGGYTLYDTANDGVVLRLAVDADRRILAVGIDATVDVFSQTINDPSPVVFRIEDDGDVDGTFAVTTLDWGTAAEAPTGITLLPDNTIIVTGTTGMGPISASSGLEFGTGSAVSRLAENGGLVGTFANNGNFTADFEPGVREGAALPFPTSGGSFLVGVYLDRDAPANDTLQITAFDGNGNLDGSFGPGGQQRFGAGSYLSGNVAGLTPNGRVVLASEVDVPSGDDLRVFRVDGYSQFVGADLTPNAFAFRDKRGIPAGANTRSETVTIRGLGQPVPISLGGDPSGRYSINGGDFTAADGEISNGDELQLRLQAGPLGGSEGETEMFVTVGSFTTGFLVRTATDRVASSFDFPDLDNQPADTQTRSIVRTPGGFNVPLRVSISGDSSCRLQIAGGDFVRRGVIAPGETLRLRVRSAPGGDQPRGCIVDLAGVTDGFTVTTMP